MNEFLNEYQYVIAWFTYCVAGLTFCAAWWRLTRMASHDGWRDLLRGISIVLIFTPWYVGEAHVHLAPAIVVVFMDFLLGSSDNGLAGSLVLLVVIAVMLVTIIVRGIFRNRRSSGEPEPLS